MVCFRLFFAASYTPNLKGKNHTISTLFDQTNTVKSTQYSQTNTTYLNQCLIGVAEGSGLTILQEHFQHVWHQRNRGLKEQTKQKNERL